MSKKDYIAIANAIKDVRADTKKGTAKSLELERFVTKLITIFETDNPNFNVSRFEMYLHDDTKRYKDFTDR